MNRTQRGIDNAYDFLEICGAQSPVRSLEAVVLRLCSVFRCDDPAGLLSRLKVSRLFA